MNSSPIVARKIKKYGWKRDLPDHRDLRLTAPGATLPPLVDLRPQCPPIYDQGELGSCTANAIAAAFEFELLKAKLPDFTPSRLFIYWNERNAEGDTSQDNGASLRDGLTSIGKLGVCPEAEWPYDVAQFATRPTSQCFQDALNAKALMYFSLEPYESSLKANLAAGYPFVLGISVYETFESQAVATTGIVPLPALTEECLGGHAVCCVGYDDSKQAFIGRNSWGSRWGLEGYFYLPYAYVIDKGLGSDFWTIRTVN
jgi:C1A family cysteine protease